jgi:biopolymer transport protein ExbD
MFLVHDREQALDGGMSERDHTSIVAFDAPFGNFSEARAVAVWMAEALSAAQRSKIRRLTKPAELDQSDEGGEINIVPFLDIVTNVLMFVLATITVTITATIDTSPAQRGVRSPTTNDLGLTVLVVPDGFSVKARGGNLAPGCTDTGSGVAVPKHDGDYDFAALKSCASRVKGSNPAFAVEHDATITANPGIPYQTIIAALDALRKDDQGAELFPDVSLGVVR